MADDFEFDEAMHQAEKIINRAKEAVNPLQDQAYEIAKGNPELRDIKKQLERIELTLHAMWIMMNKKGYTDPEFDQAMTDSLEFSKRKDFKLKGVRCPACGKNAQITNHFKIKCIYCGSEAVMHPYEIYNMLPETEYYDDVKDTASKEKAEPVIDPAFQEFEPYDVTKDLNFDELP